MSTATEDKKANRRTPTERMIAAARTAATRHDVKLPKDVDEDFEVCKAFLDKYLNLPSPKQIAYAQKLSEQSGNKIPDETLSNAKELSAWIDANK